MDSGKVIKKTRRSNSISDLDQKVVGAYVFMDQEEYYRIACSHLMQEFWMSLTTSSDHWMFVSSKGALSAGRIDPSQALFPYYSADKLSDMAGVTGPLTMIRMETANGFELWQPFAPNNTASLASNEIRQSLYKNSLGNKLVLEEVHTRLQLCFRYQWTFSHEYGFVRSCQLKNIGSERSLEILDGIQNLLPYGIDQNFQLRFSNLGDAYKKSELLSRSKLGLYYLSSIPTDRAEPSEGLRCTTVWQQGLEDAKVLLSPTQIKNFCTGKPVESEDEVRGMRACYLVNKKETLAEDDALNWRLVANINHDQTDVVNLNEFLLSGNDLEKTVSDSIQKCQNRLLKIVSVADGRQVGANRLRNNRHQSNVLFNVMRGGYPAFGYNLPKSDLLDQVRNANVQVADRNAEFLAGLSETIDQKELIESLEKHGDSDLLRIVLEYLPFTFGRRHGDPTRPWNTFKISTLNDDGSPNLDYQGNWRDIFQNWEALLLAYPQFAEGMVFRFVNATTADGYNPYRVVKNGFEWEAPDPHDPWANIGYWGDHQIIYLLKLLEKSRSSSPNQIDRWLNSDHCRYAEVPYRIRNYEQILKDPQQTIDFDFALADQVDKRTTEVGSDGKLLRNKNGDICRVSLTEKLLLTALTKMSNFVPDGGIWLNTQRPEWNDANNALVGRGLSMVTVCYLRRYFRFMIDWFSNVEAGGFVVSDEVVGLLSGISNVLGDNLQHLGNDLTASQRKQIVDGLSNAGSDYREALYSSGLSGEKSTVSKQDCLDFFERSLSFVDSTIKQNRRDDGLYHSYNLITFNRNDAGETTGIEIETLYEMLEGQVAVLSSGLLDSHDALEVLDALRSSKMYREDQKSYMLYPDRELLSFIDKNCLPKEFADSNELVQRLLADEESSIVRKDCQGGVHFNGDLRNANDLVAALGKVSIDVSASQQQQLVDKFEEIFDHARFTGRSGTFFAYEGLGSIYWHMVSKLLLAAIEIRIAASENGAAKETLDRLDQHCREIRGGIAICKTPEQYGAFPTDPYSHTPKQSGVCQPGMTGQVKEDILSRFLELGVQVEGGKVQFDTGMFDRDELLEATSELTYFDLNGDLQKMPVGVGCFAFTFCQVPVVYCKSTTSSAKIKITYSDDSQVERDDTCLTLSESHELFSRSGKVRSIEVDIVVLPNDA